MPSERAEDVWVDEMDGPERLERAKKRRAEQLKRWERRENTTGPDVKRKRKNEKSLKFQANVVMLEAAARNDLDEVTRLLENGVSPDLANEDGLTALHQSCIDGCDDMVKYLVEHNANVNACDKELWTPLHAAAACGHMSIIRYLLDNGGDILALNLDGNYPVDVIEDNEEVVKFLDKELSKLGYDEEAIEELRQNQGKELLDDLKDALEKGRSLDIEDEVGATAFHVAAANGWTSIVDFLLENEADFEIRDNDGWQPIHAAAAWGHDTTLELLVASGADLDSRTNDSKTPLDLTEEDEIIELIEDLRTKQVKYPRKGKGVRRKRSNTSNSSIKRSSIHEKNELSHADTKAERVALFTQLQNSEDSEANSPDESIASPRTLDAHFGERTTSNSSREEANSSGYVSEGSADIRNEERLESSDTAKISKPDDEAKTKRTSGVHSVEDKENIKKTDGTEKEEKSSIPPSNKAPTTIKQAPVPKPPRLATTSSSKLEPNAYINLEIEPTESSNSDTAVKESGNDAKGNSERKNLKVSADGLQNKSELNKNEENAKLRGETTSDKQKKASLPRLVSTDKRKAPEPPDSLKPANTKPDPAKVSEKKAATESKKDQANEVPKAPTKRAAPSSSPSAGHRNTAATKNQPEPKDSDATLANKTAGRGFTFPRSRKTCCLVM